MVSLCLLSCHKDDVIELPDGYGTIQFELARQNVYVLSSLTEAKSIKVTLVDDGAHQLVLPSMELEAIKDADGNVNYVSTRPYRLPVGHYAIESYRCYDMQADLIEELDITLTKNNEFDVLNGEASSISMPVQVKSPMGADNLYNTLYGLCLEVLGSDRSKWPKSWDFDGEGVDGTWAGLEFEWDVATNEAAYINGLVIDGEEEYIINSDTWEPILVSLPEFKHMKKLPACVANLTKLEGLTIRNCDMEEIDPEVWHSPITSLTIVNTQLKRLPDEIGDMRYLVDVWLEGNQFTEFPECLTRLENMWALNLIDEHITSVPASIANWGKTLCTLTISGTDIKELPDVFDKLYRVSMLDLNSNSQLSTLPASIGLVEIPSESGGFTPTGITGVNLDHCAFTEVPSVLKRPRMEYVSLCYNKLTSVQKSDFDAMTDLQTLKLDGNQFGSFPALTNPKLGYLSLMNCGLTRSQVDITGLPRLHPNFFYCE